eukprot:306233-Prymnesium_polylepis.1
MEMDTDTETETETDMDMDTWHGHMTWPWTWTRCACACIRRALGGGAHLPEDGAVAQHAAAHATDLRHLADELEAELGDDAPDEDGRVEDGRDGGGNVAELEDARALPVDVLDL